MREPTPDTWGGYLDYNKDDIQEVITAFKARGCAITLYEAAMYREIALHRASFVNHANDSREDREEGEEWKHGG